MRLPEIGHASREQVAALVGLAPYDDDSGERQGLRHIEGGRERLRKALYKAALPAAYSWRRRPDRLQVPCFRAARKAHKVTLIAGARKLLIFVNTVVARGTP